MALNAYMKLKGEKHGEVKGSVTQKGREGKILVIAAEHELMSPRDQNSGLATGKRVHKPFVITKELDRSSPTLNMMLATNENIVECEVQFWAPSASTTVGTGAEVQRYTVTLTNANIVDIKFHMLNTRNPDLVRYAESEEIAFTYERIQWTWTADGGITTQDSWTDIS